MDQFKSGLRLHWLTMVLTVLGGLVYLANGVFDADSLTSLLGPTGSSYLQIIIGLCALQVALQRETWLPFLGPVVLPTSIILPEITEGESIELPVDKDADKVIYWASLPSKSVISDPIMAYGSYENAGVVAISDEAKLKGQMTVKVQCPAQYTVFGKTLDKHVHFRFIYKGGIMSKIHTVQINC